jgi:hypothetical protein
MGQRLDHVQVFKTPYFGSKNRQFVATPTPFYYFENENNIACTN